MTAPRLLPDLTARIVTRPRRLPLFCLVLAGLLVVPGTAQASWTTTAIAVAEQYTDLDVGDGDRDGHDDTYAAHLGGVQVIRFQDGAWTYSNLTTGEVFAVGVGDGDRDGRQEVYAGFGDGGLRRFAWTGSEWNRNKIMTFPLDQNGGGSVGHIAFGDLEGDGLRELYVSAGDGQVFKVWTTGGQWHKKLMSDLPSGITELRVGDGDQDGRQELYAGSSSGTVYEVEATGASVWATTTVGTVTSGHYVAGLALGDAKHDGQEEVYASDSNKQLFRFVWDGDSWFKQALGWTDWVAGELNAADLTGNGVMELYSGTDGGRFYQHAWNGTAWKRTLLATAAGTMAGQDIGDADRDGEREIYAASSSDKVYEIDP